MINLDNTQKKANVFITQYNNLKPEVTYFVEGKRVERKDLKKVTTGKKVEFFAM